MGTVPVADVASAVPRVLPPHRLTELVRGVVRADGSVWMRVTGISMNPVVREGDAVLLEPLRRAPRRGDVVFVDAASGPLLHRVRHANSREVITRGDAATRDDPSVPPWACLAQAVAVRRGSVTIALTPTLRLGPVALLWSAAWGLRLRLPAPIARTFTPLSRAIVRAFS
jgi:hypothetical protein